MATTTAKTSIYVWQGVDRQGRITKGESSGISQAMVKAQLRKQGVVPKTVKKKPKPLFTRKQAIKPVDIAIFTRQLATMMKAGVPLVQGFEIVAEGLDNHIHVRASHSKLKMKWLRALALRSPSVNTPNILMSCFVIWLHLASSRVRSRPCWIELQPTKKRLKLLKAKIKKATTYPIAVLVVATIVTGILLGKVIPSFAESFANFGQNYRRSPKWL